MSYKVSAIITPFCRHLLAPAMALAFFVISDVGPGPKLQEACKNRHGRKPLVPLDHWAALSTLTKTVFGVVQKLCHPRLVPPTCNLPPVNELLFVLRLLLPWYLIFVVSDCDTITYIRDDRSARRLDVIGWCRRSNSDECAIFANPLAVRILCPSTLASANRTTCEGKRGALRN